MTIEILLDKPFDEKLVPEHVFENKRSYEAALYGIRLMNSVIDYCNKGYLVVEGNHVSKPQFKVVIEDDDFAVYEMISAQCHVFFIGDVHGGPNCDKVYVTKKAMKEWFKKYRFIKKSDIKNLFKDM